MLVLIGLVHLFYVLRPVDSATLKSLSGHSKHQSTLSTQEGYVLEVVKSAPQTRRSITSPPKSVANSGCYTYLQEKDGCVYANPTNNCARKMSSMAVQMVSDCGSNKNNYKLIKVSIESGLRLRDAILLTVCDQSPG